MKERPILFSAPMVRAILDGRKTQTRRIYKVRKHPDTGCEMAASELVREPQHVIDRICPYGQPGDRLWVRETWSFNFLGGSSVAGVVNQHYCVDYHAGGESKELFRNHHAPDLMRLYDSQLGAWRPSIHMPRWASRILLEVTGVRVERLQDISDNDCLAEGIHRIAHGREGYFYHHDRTDPHPKNWCHPDDAYRELWEQINGAGSWEANPWVWIIEFKQIAAIRA